jgi:signal transduction histidine kinase
MNRENVRILMIDDDEEDFLIIQDLVEELIKDSYHVQRYHYKLDWCQSYAEGISTIAEGKHDVYLVDYQLGANTGLELIQEAIANGCEVPLILLTGQSNFEVDEKAMRAGAADYLIKGKTSARQLHSALRYSIQHAKHLREIISLNSDLEKRVIQRTQVLEEAIAELNKTKEELDQALKKEKDLNDLKSRFVSMASHEFRTPLATMMSSLSLVVKYGEIGDAAQQNKHLMRIKKSIRTLTVLINDVLSVSKLEEGGVEVMPETLEIPRLVEDIVEEVRVIAKADQQIFVDYAGAQEVFTDLKIMRHILFNLLSNAIKFSEAGKRIWLGIEVNCESINITVRDEGIGISAQDQLHLFERFFRAKNATNIEGTGLGMNIVAKFVELLKGTIQCQSELGKGTTFCVRLPSVHTG